MLLLIMWLMLSTTGFNIFAEALFQKTRAFVTIYNSIPDGADLTVHCKSKDDDLAVRTLKTNGSYEFNFKPNFWGRTRYFCNFQWKDRTRGDLSRWFDIYKYSRDSPRCSKCFWRITAYFACQHNKKNDKYDICYEI
jgi:hypothetical protein